MHRRVLLQQTRQHVPLAAADVGDRGTPREVEELRDVPCGLHAGGRHGAVEDVGRFRGVLVAGSSKNSLPYRSSTTFRPVRTASSSLGQASQVQGSVHHSEMCAQAVRIVLAQQPGHVGVGERPVLPLGEDAVAGQGPQQSAQRLRLGLHRGREVLHACGSVPERVGDTQPGGRAEGGGARRPEDELPQPHGRRRGGLCGASVRCHISSDGGRHVPPCPRRDPHRYGRAGQHSPAGLDGLAGVARKVLRRAGVRVDEVGRGVACQPVVADAVPLVGGAHEALEEHDAAGQRGGAGVVRDEVPGHEGVLGAGQDDAGALEEGQPGVPRAELVVLARCGCRARSGRRPAGGVSSPTTNIPAQFSVRLLRVTVRFLRRRTVTPIRLPRSWFRSITAPWVSVAPPSLVTVLARNRPASPLSRAVLRWKTPRVELLLGDAPLPVLLGSHLAYGQPVGPRRPQSVLGEAGQGQCGEGGVFDGTGARSLHADAVAGLGAAVGGLLGRRSQYGVAAHAAQGQPGSGHPDAFTVGAGGHEDGVSRSRGVHRLLNRLSRMYREDRRAGDRLGSSE